MIYMGRQEGLYQNKVNSSLYSTCNCKMGYFSYEQEHGPLQMFGPADGVCQAI